MWTSTTGGVLTLGEIGRVPVVLRSLQPGYGHLLVRGAELGAATLVFVFGILLLAGYVVSERMVGF